jgi:hypothetical protein
MEKMKALVGELTHTDKILVLVATSLLACDIASLTVMHFVIR